MNSQAIAINDRFTDFELFQMFNIDCDPNIDARETRVPYVEGEYEFNDVKCPMWRNIKRSLSRGEKKAVTNGDLIRDGVTDAPSGSKQRIADLAAYYQSQTEEKSAFLV